MQVTASVTTSRGLRGLRGPLAAVAGCSTRAPAAAATARFELGGRGAAAAARGGLVEASGGIWTGDGKGLGE